MRKMKQNRERAGNAGRRETIAGEKSLKCCGNCRYCEKGTGGSSLRCRRHKIETYFAALCGECEIMIAPEG